MTRSDMQARVNALREELEARHKTGNVKIANADGSPVSTLKLQDELYSLIYRLSKRDG